MMNRKMESRPANHLLPEEFPPDRRASCRYPVAEIPAVIGWWVQGGGESEPSGPEFAPEPILEDTTRMSPAEANIYSMIMARGSGLGNAGQAAAQDGKGAPTAQQNGKAANPFVQNQKAANPFIQNQKAASPFFQNRAASAVLSGAKPVQAASPSVSVEPPAAQHGRTASSTRERVDLRNDSAPAAESEEPKLCTCDARILDVSQSGISLLSDAAPRGDQAIWVRLEGAHPTEWVETTLRGVATKDQGMYVVRLSFRDACPYDFFKAAVYGYFGS